MNDRTRRAVSAATASGVALIAGAESLIAWKDWPIPAASVGLMLAATAFGFTRKSITAQVAARGHVWLIFGFTAFWRVLSLFANTEPFPWWAWPLLAFSGATLWLSAPLLRTKEALAQFAPAQYRRAFLAGATATSSVAGGAAWLAATGLQFHSPLMVAFNAGLAGLLMLAVRGLMNMRTWGMLLGGFASVVCLALFPVYGLPGFTLVLAALPVLLFWVLPIYLARRSARRVRVADDLLAQPNDEHLVAVGAGALGANAALLGEEPAGGRLRVGEVLAHEDLADESPAGLKQLFRDR